MDNAAQISNALVFGVPVVPCDLKTKDGRFVTRVGVPQTVTPDTMPEIVVWGDRFFIRKKGEHFDDLDYREGWACPVDGSVLMRRLPDLQVPGDSDRL